jgi:hypothetical protein
MAGVADVWPSCVLALAVHECDASAACLLGTWRDVFAASDWMVSLLLANPLEVVALACEDPVWQPKLLSLLGPVNVRGETLTPVNLLESVKLLKTPSWRYRTEVQGLLETACLRVTGGKHRTLEAVRAVLPPFPSRTVSYPPIHTHTQDHRTHPCLHSYPPMSFGQEEIAAPISQIHGDSSLSFFDVSAAVAAYVAGACELRPRSIIGCHNMLGFSHPPPPSPTTLIPHPTMQATTNDMCCGSC